MNQDTGSIVDQILLFRAVVLQHRSCDETRGGKTTQTYSEDGVIQNLYCRLEST